MNKCITVALFLMFVMSCRPVHKSESSEIDRRVDALLSKMTLKEKIGQMSQIDVATLMKRVDPHGSFYGPYVEPNKLDRDSLEKYIAEYGISCVFNIGPHG